SLRRVLQARQRGIGCSRRSFATHCGSAMRVRPSATKSVFPAATAWVAIAGSPRRPTAITGTRTIVLTAAAKSRKGASGKVIGGGTTPAPGQEREWAAAAGEPAAPPPPPPTPPPGPAAQTAIGRPPPKGNPPGKKPSTDSR